MSRNENELRLQEASLAERRFSQEDSTLSRIDYDFPPVDNQTFIKVISERFKQTGFSILELGGGISQRVAIEIVSKFPEIRYVGLDKRKLQPDAISRLTESDNYRFVQTGVSELSTLFPTKDFNIIFAHNVGKHMPNPFYMLELAYPLLKPNGLFYTNHIPLYKNEWQKITLYLNDQYPGMLSAITYQAPSPLTKAGIIQVSLAIEKVQDELHLPLTIGEKYIEDTEGVFYDTHEIFFADKR